MIIGNKPPFLYHIIIQAVRTMKCRFLTARVAFFIDAVLPNDSIHEVVVDESRFLHLSSCC